MDAARPAPDLQQPHQPDGRPTAPWVGEGYAPAGLGVTTTAADLARYATALLEGRAPGMAALEPRADAMPGLRIGLAWVVAGSDADPVVWHNGGTGGTRTMLALDRGTGEATLVLTNTARDVTGAGLVLLGAEPGSVPPPPPFDADTVGWVAGGVVTSLLFACGAVVGRSRIRIGGQGLAALGGLVMWLVAAPWDWAPPWVFGLFAGFAVAAAVVAGLRWRTLPWVAHRWRPVAYVVAALGVLWFVAMLAMAGWVLALSLA